MPGIGRSRSSSTDFVLETCRHIPPLCFQRPCTVFNYLCSWKAHHNSFVSFPCVPSVQLPVFLECTDTSHPCISSPTGQYIVGECTGKMRSDTAYCVSCSFQKCLPGQYIEEQCDGTTVLDQATCTDCTAQACDPGEYIIRVCDGKGSEDISGCSSCSHDACDVGFYRPICTGTETGPAECVSCSAGSCLFVSFCIFVSF